MPPAAFSRVALAAALLEYDNDTHDPMAIKKSAKDSAIFAHLRKTGPITQPQNIKGYDDLPEPRRRKDYLRVALPAGERKGPTTEPVNFGGPPPRPSRETRRSLDILREQGEQYFENQDGDGEGSEASDDVDLTSWGLDSLIPPKSAPSDKPSRRPGPAKPRPASQHLDNLPNPHSPQDEDFQPHFDPSIRAASLFGDSGAQNLTVHDAPHLAATFPLAGRRQDFTSPLDEFGQFSAAPPRTYSPAPIDPASVPLPDRESFDLDEPEPDDTFAVPLPAPDRLSRFDPKAQEQVRSQSRGSWVSHDELGQAPPPEHETSDEEEVEREGEDQEEGPSSRPRSVAPLEGDINRQSQIEPNIEEIRRSQHLKIMRPKVLVMPSPLRDRSDPAPPSKVDTTRRAAGFLDSTDDRPLPVGFRTSVALPTRPGPRPLGASQSAPGIFPYNPRMSLSTSQMMFRDSLMVGGQRDSSYAADTELGVHMKRAMVDGEKIEIEEGIDPDRLEAEYQELYRPSGKLLGTSLMDKLEARKNEIKGKRRYALFSSCFRCQWFRELIFDVLQGILGRQSTIYDGSDS